MMRINETRKQTKRKWVRDTIKPQLLCLCSELFWHGNSFQNPPFLPIPGSSLEQSHSLLNLWQCFFGRSRADAHRWMRISAVLHHGKEKALACIMHFNMQLYSSFATLYNWVRKWNQEEPSTLYVLYNKFLIQSWNRYVLLWLPQICRPWQRQIHIIWISEATCKYQNWWLTKDHVHVAKNLIFGWNWRSLLW